MFAARRLLAQQLRVPQGEGRRQGSHRRLAGGLHLRIHDVCLFDSYCYRELKKVSYYASGPSDLCYLLYSSTTSGFRRAHKDRLCKLYYDTFVRTAAPLFNDDDGGWTPPFQEDFFREMRKVRYYHPMSTSIKQSHFEPAFLSSTQSMKMCLLFCASAGDLKLCDIDDDGSPATSPSAATHSGGIK